MLLRYWFVSVVLLVCGSVGFGQQAVADGVQLTTLKAPFAMRILAQDLDITGVKAKPDQQSAYFMMTSGTTNLNVSVYIEPVGKCTTAEACRDMVLKSGNPAWGEYQDLKKGTLGNASYFEFYRPVAAGKPLKMQDMYAQFVREGYWIDLHISKVLYDPAKDRAKFEDVVKGVSFPAKPVFSSGEFNREAAKVDAASAAWLSLWDAAKCPQTFRAMSSITRSENTEESWVGYCSKITGAVGPLKTRTPIAIAITRSLPPKTDRPLAILAYQTDFAKRPSVVEIVGLILEKDGRWLVTNYFPQ
jgi:hypothetical protein